MIPPLSNQLCHHPSLSSLMEETWGVLEAQAIHLAGVMSSSLPNLFCLCCCEDRMCKIWIASTIGAQQFIKQMLTFHSEHFISLQSTVTKKAQTDCCSGPCWDESLGFAIREVMLGAGVSLVWERRWGSWHLLRTCVCHSWARLHLPSSPCFCVLDMVIFTEQGRRLSLLHVIHIDSACSLLGWECTPYDPSLGRERPHGFLHSACLNFPYAPAVYPYYVTVINWSCEFNCMLTPSEFPKVDVSQRLMFTGTGFDTQGIGFLYKKLSWHANKRAWVLMSLGKSCKTLSVQFLNFKYLS